jgi:ubiquinone biosynthesis protein
MAQHPAAPTLPPAAAGASSGVGSVAESGGRRRGRLWELRICLRRFFWLLRVLVRHGFAHFLAPRVRASFLGRFGPVARRLPAEELSGPERLRVTFEDLGGTFVKFGQMLALQPDILSVEYCDALFKLLDRIAPFPFEAAERTFREELGKGPEEVFDSIERDALATASVGQVHVAYLGRRKVAVKFQRPNVEIEFLNDVRLMVVTVHLIQWLHVRPLYWLIRPTREFVSWSREELDYRYEARYSEELRRYAVDNPIQHVPEVIPEYTTRRTLVVEFLEGVTLLDYLRAREVGDEVLIRRLEAAGFVPERFAGNIVSNFLNDAFQRGIYHADLHPANLMILPDNVVGYLDFGITGLMSRYSRRHLLAMTLALARGDVETMKDEYLRITGREKRCDEAALRAGLDRLALGWYETVGGRRRLSTNITKIFNEMLSLSRKTGFLPERDIVKFIRSAIAIDGLLTRFDPTFDLGRHIGRVCAHTLSWQARSEWLSADRLLDWSSAGGRLVADAPGRFVRWAGERGRRPPPAAADRPATASAGVAGGVWGAESVQLAAALCGVAALIAFVQEPAPLGINLWTAEWLFLGVAGWQLAGSLRRQGTRP